MTQTPHARHWMRSPERVHVRSVGDLPLCCNHSGARVGFVPIIRDSGAEHSTNFVIRTRRIAWAILAPKGKRNEEAVLLMLKSLALRNRKGIAFYAQAYMSQRAAASSVSLHKPPMDLQFVNETPAPARTMGLCQTSLSRDYHLTGPLDDRGGFAGLAWSSLKNSSFLRHCGTLCHCKLLPELPVTFPRAKVPVKMIGDKRQTSQDAS